MSSDRPGYLRPLSDAQYRAATYKPNGSLIVSSAPGSGKTRILVARVAWLIRECNIKPEDCIVVTFTNKAAKEMRSRLTALIGNDLTNKVVLGTFHSTCVRYLRKYGSLISLPNQFKIVDIDDVKKILKEVISNLDAEMNEAGIEELKPDTCLNEISSAKSKNLNPAEYMALGTNATSVKAPGGSQPSQGLLKRYNKVLGLVYKNYEETLRKMSALDFDDLLVYGSRLLKQHPNVVSNVQHVLVDEFQDTNITQLELLNHFSSARRSVTVVGDPDQSIYGWRFAEIGNLKTMKKDFPGTEEIKLEQTYRSSASIVEASLAVVKQDTGRLEKGLFTAHERGLPVVLNKSSDELQESFFIASEVKRVIAEHGGMISYKDFAVLLRYNAMSRSVEQELTKLSIPSKMLGGHKFFDRVEIKDILAYLTLVDNPSYILAFSRIINVPKRGVGDKLLKDYFDLAENLGKKPMELAEEIVYGGKNISGIKPTIKKALENVLRVLKSVRKLANQGKDVGVLIDRIIELIDYRSYLEKDINTLESRLQNLQELKSFASTVAGSTSNIQNLPDLDSIRPSAFEKEKQVETKVENEEKEERKVVKKRKSNSGSQIEIKVESNVTDDSSIRRSSRKRTKINQNQDDLIAGAEAEFNQGGEDEEIDEFDGGGEQEEDEDEDESQEKEFSRKVKGKGKAKDSKIDYESDSNDSISKEEEVSLEPALFGDDQDEIEKTPLRQFLESCTLSTDLESDEESAEDKVTISTVHSAKGLEWPVVFVIGIESGTFPFFRSDTPEQVNEERRLLYVAMTRSQGLLYLTHTERRMRAGRYNDAYLSDFVKEIKPSEVKWESNRPNIDEKSRKIMSQILERNCPKEEDVVQSMTAFHSLNILSKAPISHQANRGSNWGASRWASSPYGSSSQSAPSSSQSQSTNINRWSSQPNPNSNSSSSPQKPIEKAPVGNFYSSFSRPKVSDFPSSSNFFNNAKTGSTSFNNANNYKFNSNNLNEKKKEKPLKAAPSFTNQYRLESKDPSSSSSSILDDGNSLYRRPKADLNSFQKNHQNTMNGLLDLLPPSENEKNETKNQSQKECTSKSQIETEFKSSGSITRGTGRGRSRGRGRGARGGRGKK